MIFLLDKKSLDGELLIPPLMYRFKRSSVKSTDICFSWLTFLVLLTFLLGFLLLFFFYHFNEIRFFS